MNAKLVYKWSKTHPTKLLGKILHNGDFIDPLQVRIDYDDTHVIIETNQFNLTMEAITLISDLELISIETREKACEFESIVKSYNEKEKCQNIQIYLN